MMPPGHIALTWAAAEHLPEPPDYRWLALSALLPDLIDKPLALWLFTRSHSSQNVSHALIPNALLLLSGLFFWRRGLPYILAFNGHLLADRMWRHTETFWWPLYGWQRFWHFRYMNSPEAMVNVYLEIVRRYPRVWIIELLAILYLAYFGHKYRLYQPTLLKRFLLWGRPAQS